MNDRFLSRGKSKDSGEWVVGYYCPTAFTRFPCKPSIYPAETINHHWHAVEIIPETLGGCTGLTDKHNKLIFEGDIVELNHPYNGKSKHTVVWDNYEWNLSDFHASCFDYPSEAFSEGTKYMTVIGNIHDNPELLKEVVQNGG